MPKKSRTSQNQSRFNSRYPIAMAVWLSAAGCLFAYELKNDKEVSSKKPVNITSNDLTFDRPRGLTLFSGNVKALHDQITLLADEIRAMEENREASANGHIHVVDRSQGITLTCGNLEYQDLMNVMTAHDHPLLTTQDEKGRPVSLLGRQMELDSEQKTVVINQNVQILHPNGHAEAQKATYLSEEDKLILEDNPKVYTDNGLLSGRRITSNLGDDRSILVEGMADAIFNPNGKPVATPTSKGTPAPNGPVTNNVNLSNNADHPIGVNSTGPSPTPTAYFRW